MATVQQDKCPDDFMCPITLELMKKPFILFQSGHTYEKKALQYALIERPNHDPLTNATFEGEAQIGPNHSLRKAIEQWVQIQEKVGALTAWLRCCRRYCLRCCLCQLLLMLLPLLPCKGASLLICRPNVKPERQPTNQPTTRAASAAARTWSRTARSRRRRRTGSSRSDRRRWRRRSAVRSRR